ncbi:uncharacterized protein LOC127240707 [Andrographis paniculata]|uniref:uncharacterized protein LOC127240707 n=1 Tax=Andrographis paniculata TaxID=175694 RepID=UPI0021E89D02|nr:uncharacterized protein LOC127240707 [Andrographis paniculata]
MAQMSEMCVTASIKASPQKWYNFLKYEGTKIAAIVPEIVKEAKLIYGQEGHVGNVKLFVYAFGAVKGSAQLETTVLNDSATTVGVKVIAGDILQLYPHFAFTATIKQGSIVWSIDYEKASALIPDPTIYAQLLVQITAALDAWILIH